MKTITQVLKDKIAGSFHQAELDKSNLREFDRDLYGASGRKIKHAIIEALTLERLAALQRDSRYAIWLMIGTTLEGKYSLSSGSHFGHDVIGAALAWAGVDRARISDSAMSFLINSLYFCWRPP